MKLAGAAWFLIAFSALAAPLHSQCRSSDGTHPGSSAARYHPGIDVLDYEMMLDLPDTGAVIEARALLTIRRTALLDTLRLDLVGLRVDSVLVNGHAVRFRRDRDRIHVPLPCGTDDQLSVAVRYGGAVRDGLIIRSDSAGRWTAFGDNWPNRARHWIPSIDHPSDKATVTWVILAPSSRHVVANGDLQERLPLGVLMPGRQPRTLTRWRLDRPIPVYLMVIAAAPLAYHELGRTACGLSENGGCVPQGVYAMPESFDYLPGPFVHAAGITEYFARLFGPFPYSRLSHVQSSTRFGGMENATAIFYADRLFRQRSVRPGLIAHETAHQWFGNSVTPGEWAHLWLSEGFASYLEPLWVQHHSGDTAFVQVMAEMRQRVLAAPVVAQRPVLDTAETDYLRLLNANSYQKGAWVLHMLRAQIGDSSFFRGARSYYSRHSHGNALTDDLRAAMEEAAGQPLDWFFDQWLRRPGFVELTTSWSWDARARRVILQVEQGARFPPYRFPLTVEIHDARGRVHRSTLAVEARPSQRITVPIELDASPSPSSIVIDPDVQLLASIRER